MADRYLRSGWDAATLTSAIKLQRPRTTPELLRSDSAIAPHVHYALENETGITALGLGHLLPVATVRDDLQLRAFATSKDLGNP